MQSPWHLQSTPRSGTKLMPSFSHISSDFCNFPSWASSATTPASSIAISLYFCCNGGAMVTSNADVAKPRWYCWMEMSALEPAFAAQSGARKWPLNREMPESRSTNREIIALTWIELPGWLHFSEWIWSVLPVGVFEKGRPGLGKLGKICVESVSVCGVFVPGCWIGSKWR